MREDNNGDGGAGVVEGVVAKGVVVEVVGVVVRCTQARWRCRARDLLQVTIFIDRAAGGGSPDEPRHPRRRWPELPRATRPRWLLRSRRVWLSLRFGGPAAPHTLQQHHTEAPGVWPPPAPRHPPPQSAGGSAPPPRPSITTAGMRGPPRVAHTGRRHTNTQDAAPLDQYTGRYSSTTTHRDTRHTTPTTTKAHAAAAASSNASRPSQSSQHLAARPGSEAEWRRW